MCSSATAFPQVSPKMHSAGAVPYQDASAASNICTKTVPTSRRTHSSKTVARNVPHASEPTERSVSSVLPSSTRSTIGMNWMKRGAELVAEVAVDLERRVLVRGVHRAEHVPVDAGGDELVEPGPHPGVGGAGLLVDAVGVVHRLGPVDADARRGTASRGGTRTTRR